MRRAGAVLDAAGIPWVLVKGPALDLGVYPVPHLRSYVDVDVLVPPRHFRAGLDALTAAGWDHVVRNWVLARDVMASEITLDRAGGSVIDYR